MKQTRDIMGMPVTVEIADETARQDQFDRAFRYFEHVDTTFSTYKEGSEISRINRGEIGSSEYSDEMKEVFMLSDETKKETNGYFDIQKTEGTYDPSGLVKGWAIRNAADLLAALGCEHFYVDAGGDIQTSGKNSDGGEWSVGIRNPFDRGEVIKVVYPRGQGVATSGTYIRGEHIYDPHSGKAATSELAAITVIGPDIYEADRFATAAFAMGKRGIEFIERLPGFEGYAVFKDGTAVMTSGFENFTHL